MTCATKPTAGPRRRPILIGGLVLVLAGCGDGGPRVETQAIERQDLVERVRASGRVRPKHSVDVSASVMGKIVELYVEEGDRVALRDTLVRIDPVPAGNRLTQALAQVRAAEAALATAESRVEETVTELRRQERLFEQNVTAESQLIAARTAHAVAERTVQQLRAEVEAARAAAEIARHDFGQVTILSEIDGIVVRLNVEEGENVVTGTMNVPGTVLMTIADLSVMEAVVLVDETDIVSVRPGLRADVTVDAFPDVAIPGVVTEVGNASATAAPLGTQQSIDYMVVLVLEEALEGLRPDLSATAEITIAERDDVLAVPIRALTLRDPSGAREPDADGDAAVDGVAPRDDVDGVFVLEGETVRFQPVTTGITGERDFEVIEGLGEGDVIVAGPFETIRRLSTGDRVRVRRGPRDDDE